MMPAVRVPWSEQIRAGAVDGVGEAGRGTARVVVVEPDSLSMTWTLTLLVARRGDTALSLPHDARGSGGSYLPRSTAVAGSGTPQDGWPVVATAIICDVMSG